MKVEHLFQTPLLKEASILAGRNGQDRHITNVSMMDAPDIGDYLNEHDLLVTTAYHFKDNPAMLTDLIQHMSDKGCAGIGIKTKRFLHEVPEEAAALADELDFPIIDLPAHISLSTIAAHLLSSMLDTRTSELQKAISAHQTFTRHIISGKDLQSLIVSVAATVNQPVFMLDHHARLIASSEPMPDVIDSFTTLYKRNYLFFLENTTHTTFSLLASPYTQITLFPIYTHESTCSYLAVAGKTDSFSSELVLTMEQAANVIAFERLKENALKQHQQKARNEFFINYLEGAFTTKEEIINRAKEFNLPNEEKYICVVGKVDRQEKWKSFTQSQLETSAVFDFIQGELSGFPFPPHLFIKGEMLIILLQADEHTGEAVSAITSVLKSLQAETKSYFQRTISFGISNITHQFLDVDTAFREARDALQTGQLSGVLESVQAYQTKDVAELLRVIPVEDLKEFYIHTMQQLGQAGNDDPTLLYTLAVYLETHCHISETAKRLYVHRNTVIYRLEKCEELIDKSLKDPEITLRLRLALRIRASLSMVD